MRFQFTYSRIFTAIFFLNLVLSRFAAAAEDGFERVGYVKKYALEVERFASVPEPEPGGILMVGSSIFRMWTNCSVDLAPFPINNRSFGGAQTEDQLYFFDKIVPSSFASLIIWYCGSADIAKNRNPNDGNNSPEVILRRTKMWIDLTQKALPDSDILLVSIIRSPKKKYAGLLHKVDGVNRGLEQFAESIKKVYYIDVNPSLETIYGDPLMECYISDGLHMSPEGYRRIASLLKPAMEKIW